MVEISTEYMFQKIGELFTENRAISEENTNLRQALAVARASPAAKAKNPRLRKVK